MRVLPYIYIYIYIIKLNGIVDILFFIILADLPKISTFSQYIYIYIYIYIYKRVYFKINKIFLNQFNFFPDGHYTKYHSSYVY